MNIKTSRKILDNLTIRLPGIEPCKVNLVCDATFFGKKKDKDGLLIFLDSTTGKVLWFKFIESETKAEYREGLTYLEDKGFEIESVTIDGRRGITEVFKKYPTQICQFHVQSAILRRTTLKPKTRPGYILKKLAVLFIQGRWNQEYFTRCILGYLETYTTFLGEKNEQGQYIHRNIRSALYGIKLARPYLFTFKDYPSLNIPNTTNHIDGGVNPKVKELVRRHRGMNRDRRNKLISNLLCSLGKRN